jgi:hypothetical protein
MRRYEAASIGIIVGLIYGALLWFIKSQMISIYSQRAAFRIYYNPDAVAFSGAALTSILCLIVILSHRHIYSFFETIAIGWQMEEKEDDEG